MQAYYDINLWHKILFSKSKGILSYMGLKNLFSTQ